MRRRERVAKYSLSVTDEKWERVKARANRSGMTVSAYLVESALAVDPGQPALSLALNYHEQKALVGHAQRIEFQIYMNRAEDSSMLEKIHNSTSFLARQKMMDMIQEGRSEDLLATLTAMLGEDEAARIIKALMTGGSPVRQGQG